MSSGPTEPLNLQDHLFVVAAASRARRARLWMVLASPLLSVIVLGPLGPRRP